MDSRKCQTSTATPPEAGGLPWVARTSRLSAPGTETQNWSNPGCGAPIHSFLSLVFLHGLS